MDVNWKKMLTRTTVWLLAEIILNIAGLDGLADYSEFIHDRKLETLANSVSICLLSPSQEQAIS